MNEIIDISTTLPVFPHEYTPLADNEFKSKWYDRYKSGGCTLDHIQRLYNLDKITIDDFVLITGEEPSEKVIPPKSEISKLQDEVATLKEENEGLKNGLKAVLVGDVQGLAYLLYPEDFNSLSKD